jgi:hypothetical protein
LLHNDTGGDSAIRRLHAEMDALLADSSKGQLTPDQQMLLRQAEINNRARMEAHRMPVTPSFDRVMTRDGAPGVPQESRPDPLADPFGLALCAKKGLSGLRCFRACS